jgi:hypothetical protein
MPARISSLCVAVSLIVASMTLNARGVGMNHTSDVALERFFNQHQTEFEALLAEVQADSVSPQPLRNLPD